MKPCRCDRWLPECFICGRPGSRIEYLALVARVDLDWLRDYLRREIEARRDVELEDAA